MLSTSAEPRSTERTPVPSSSTEFATIFATAAEPDSSSQPPSEIIEPKTTSTGVTRPSEGGNTTITEMVSAYTVTAGKTSATGPSPGTTKGSTATTGRTSTGITSLTESLTTATEYFYSSPAAETSIMSTKLSVTTSMPTIISTGVTSAYANLTTATTGKTYTTSNEPTHRGTISVTTITLNLTSDSETLFSPMSY
ncbi:mucin-7-like [Penaeus indicus]|uniref:mucin-7-like n=1 Tax=Penaeus indicus TaxID=29960 RepID=UPI00300D9881